MKKTKKKNKKKKKSVQKVTATRVPHSSCSSTGTFLSCRRAAYYHLIRRITPRTPKIHFIIGTIWHKTLEAWYTWRKIGPAKKAIDDTIQKDLNTGYTALTTPSIVAITRATIMGMFLGYVEKFGKEDLKKWKWLKSEHPFTIENFLGSGIDFVGIIDGIVEISRGPNKGIWIVENKTTRDLSYFTVEAIKNSHQTLGYIHAVIETLDIHPKGIIWNAIRKPSKRLKQNQTVDEYCEEIREDYKARPEFFFLREQLRINPSAIEKWLEEMQHIMLDMELCYRHPNDTNFWYKNNGMCGMYGGCDFAPLCHRGEKRSTLMLYRSIEH